jgi:hypothetical protein
MQPRRQGRRRDADCQACIAWLAEVTSLKASQVRTSRPMHSSRLATRNVPRCARSRNTGCMAGLSLTSVATWRDGPPTPWLDTRKNGIRMTFDGIYCGYTIHVASRQEGAGAFDCRNRKLYVLGMKTTCTFVELGAQGKLILTGDELIRIICTSMFLLNVRRESSQFKNVA